jgi:hypothetical protein
MSSIRIYQELKLIIPKYLLEGTYLSFPKWGEMKVSGSKGFVRDRERAEPGRRLPYRDYDKSFLHSYEEHLAHLGLPWDLPLLAMGNGNLGNNLRFVAYTREKGLFELPGEDASSSDRVYTCFCVEPGAAPSIEKLTFTSGQPGTDIALSWASSGQPLVWDSAAVPIEETAIEFYDLRHVFHLPTEARISEDARRLARDQLDWLMENYMNVYSLPAPEANAILNREAARLKLKREGNYLQSAVGVNSDFIFIVQRHGTIEDIAQTFINLGAERAILLDQGGSVGTYFRSRSQVDNGPLECNFIFTSHYFRKRRLSVIVFALSTDNILEDRHLSDWQISSAL